MLIDCDQCVMQSTDACNECIVPVLLGPVPIDDPIRRRAGASPGGRDGSAHRPGPVELDEAEALALDNLAEVGLVPRLKLVPKDQPPDAAAC